MKVTEKLAALRGLMCEQGLSAYIVPGADPHASEYMAAHWMEMSWLSGFKGVGLVWLVIRFGHI